MNRPGTLTEVVEGMAVDADAFHRGMSGFLDTFYTAPDKRQEMIDDEPPLTGNAKIDAYLGAVGEHLARRWGLRVPAWTANPRRTLRKPYFVGGIEALKPMLLAQSPLAFRKRMIFVEAEPLKRARMPRDGATA